VGTAVPRATAPPTLPIGPPLLVPPRVWPYAGGAIGFGYFYDPFVQYGFGSWPYGSASFPGYASDGSTADPFDKSGPTGRLRLLVEPKDAEVFVDGDRAGIVDQFNGHSQHLDLPVGPHHVEVRAPGYEPLVVDVSIQAHHTTEYRGKLTPSQH
jgi:hypothetical protein